MALKKGRTFDPLFQKGYLNSFPEFVSIDETDIPLPLEGESLGEGV